MTDTAPGQFWCDRCQTAYPDSLQQAHLASHGSDRVDLGDPIMFWLLCILAGVCAALAVALLS